MTTNVITRIISGNYVVACTTIILGSIIGIVTVTPVQPRSGVTDIGRSWCINKPYRVFCTQTDGISKHGGTKCFVSSSQFNTIRYKVSTSSCGTIWFGYRKNDLTRRSFTKDYLTRSILENHAKYRTNTNEITWVSDRDIKVHLPGCLGVGNEIKGISSICNSNGKYLSYQGASWCSSIHLGVVSRQGGSNTE